MTRPKLFRDPVHDLVTLDADDPAEGLVLRLLATPTVQRLRRVRQLALAHLVYHGAEHSRFAHSMGVLHVAGRMLRVLALGRDISDGERQLTLAAALLHDVGHGPLSHAIEKSTDVRHEAVTRALIVDPATEVHKVLNEVDPELPEAVAELVHPDHTTQPRLAADIVSSQLDADRLDYILRDGHATGVKIGVFDLERILSMLECDGEGRVVVNHRAREAVEGYLLARLHMYKQVYLHKAVRSAEAMLVGTLRRAGQLLASGRQLPVPHATLGRLLEYGELAPIELVSLDDADVWVALRAWATADDPVLAELADGLVNRRLYKTVTLPGTVGASGPVVTAAREAIRRAGGDPAFHLLIDRAEDVPYRPYVPHLKAARRPILIAQEETLRPIEAVSDLAQLLGKLPYSVVRLCFPARYREAVTGAVGDR